MTLRRAAAIGLVILFASGAGAPSARAHPMQFGLLTLTEQAPGRFEVRFHYSGSEALPDRAQAVLPGHCAGVGGRRVVGLSSGVDATWTVDCGEQGLRGLVGAEGLADASAQVLLRIRRLEGGEEQHLLDRATPLVEVGAAAGATATGSAGPGVFASYLGLGVEHILFGFDHLAFVLGLLLLVVRWRPLVATITAFTVGHSITLALATVGLIGVPVAAVEACIAASILLLAVELAHPERPWSLTHRWPWLVSGAFGLLHGLGFAGALAEVGLPEGDIPMALLAFNLGVELGQLAFVLAVVALQRAVRRIGSPERARWVATYGIGALSAYWLIERVAAFGA